MNVRIAFLGLWSLLKATHADVFDYECISDLPTCGTFLRCCMRFQCLDVCIDYDISNIMRLPLIFVCLVAAQGWMEFLAGLTCLAQVKGQGLDMR